MLSNSRTSSSPVRSYQCGRKFAADDESVQVWLRQDSCLLGSTEAVEDGVVNHHPTPAVLLQGVYGVCVPKHPANVLAYEAWFAIRQSHGTYGVTVKVEDLWLHFTLSEKKTGSKVGAATPPIEPAGSKP